MRWWPFRGRGDGRHALGAAVTSIPSGPLVVPVSLPLVAPAVDPEVAAALARAQAEAELLPALPLAEVTRLLRAPEPLLELPRQADNGPRGRTPSPSTSDGVHVSGQGDAQTVAAPSPAHPHARVQLGFRDGSTSPVDDADQARALEDLARALTSSG